MRRSPSYCTWSANRCREYKCHYGGLDDEGKPVTTHLQAFEAMVLEDLYKAICFEFPPPPPPLSALEFERSFHEHFVEDRSRQFVGRLALIKQMCDMVDKDALQESLPIVVIGQPGVCARCARVCCAGASGGGSRRGSCTCTLR